MKLHSKCYVIAAMLALSVAVSGCSSEETAEKSSQTTVESKAEPAIPGDWKEIHAAGVSMRVPESMCDFEAFENGIYVSYDDAETAVLLVFEPEEGATLTPQDLGEEDAKDIFLNTYDSVTMTEFDHDYQFDGTPAVYARADVTDSDGIDQEVIYFFILPGDGTMQVVQATIVNDGSSGLNGKLDAWISSLTWTDEPDENTADVSDSSDSSESGSSGSLSGKLNSSISDWNRTGSSSGSSSSSSSSSGSSSSVANSPYGCINDYFYVRVPESWADSVLTHEYASSDGTCYYYALHEPTSYEALSDGGKLVTFCLLPQGYDYSTWPDYDVLGTMDLDGDLYTVLASYPTDAGFTPETEAAYREWMAQVPDVVATFTAQDGYTFTPAS